MADGPTLECIRLYLPILSFQNLSVHLSEFSTSSVTGTDVQTMVETRSRGRTSASRNVNDTQGQPRFF